MCRSGSLPTTCHWESLEVGIIECASVWLTGGESCSDYCTQLAWRNPKGHSFVLRQRSDTEVTVQRTCCSTTQLKWPHPSKATVHQLKQLHHTADQCAQAVLALIHLLGYATTSSRDEATQALTGCKQPGCSEASHSISFQGEVWQFGKCSCVLSRSRVRRSTALTSALQPCSWRTAAGTSKGHY